MKRLIANTQNWKTISACGIPLLFVIFALSGCSQNEQEEAAREPYFFIFDNVKMEVNVDAEPIILKLGNPISVFEAPTCAFDGKDVLYSYQHFDVDVFEYDVESKIYSIALNDDLVTTEEGISVGDSVEKVIEKYGNADVSGGSYVYAAEGMALEFIAQNDYVIAIRYYSTTLDEMVGTNSSNQANQMNKKDENRLNEPFLPRDLAAYLYEELEINIDAQMPAPVDFFDLERLTTERNLGEKDLNTLSFDEFPGEEEVKEPGIYPVTIIADDMVLNTRLRVVGQEDNTTVSEREETDEKSKNTIAENRDIFYQTELLNRKELNVVMPENAELKGILDEVMPQVIDGANTTEEKVRKCYDYLISDFGYSTTKKYDYETDAVIFFNTHRGSCTYYVAALHYMLMYIGVDNKIVDGYRYQDPNTRDKSFHRWVEISLEGTQYVLDPQWEDTLSSESGNMYQRYLLSHEDLNKYYAF